MRRYDVAGKSAFTTRHMTFDFTAMLVCQMILTACLPSDCNALILLPHAEYKIVSHLTITRETSHPFEETYVKSAGWIDGSCVRLKYLMAAGRAT